MISKINSLLIQTKLFIKFNQKFNHQENAIEEVRLITTQTQFHKIKKKRI